VTSVHVSLAATKTNVAVVCTGLLPFRLPVRRPSLPAERGEGQEGEAEAAVVAVVAGRMTYSKYGRVTMDTPKGGLRVHRPIYLLLLRHGK